MSVIKPRRRGIWRFGGAIVLLVLSSVVAFEMGVVAARATTTWVRGECCDLVRHPTEPERFQFQCGPDRRPLEAFEVIVPSMVCLGFRALHV